MTAVSVYALLNIKDTDTEKIVEAILREPGLIDDLIACLNESDHTIRENAFNSLLSLADRSPTLLSPYWDQFVSMLNSRNAFVKSIGIYLIIPLAGTDYKDTFDIILDQLLDAINNPSVVVASNLARNIGKLLSHRPDLEKPVLTRIFNFDDTAQTQHVEIVKGHLIEGLQEYFPNAKNKHVIEQFVRQQLNSLSPSTRKRARAFLLEYT